MRSTAATSSPRVTPSPAARTWTGRTCWDLTPLELSVDLARNDISFLLLSLRGRQRQRERRAGRPRRYAARTAHPRAAQAGYRGSPGRGGIRPGRRGSASPGAAAGSGPVRRQRWHAGALRRFSSASIPTARAAHPQAGSGKQHARALRHGLEPGGELRVALPPGLVWGKRRSR